MEEEAELALLEQHLQQTNKLAARMTGILTQLDSRLARLDKTIAPFGIQPLTKEAQNIDMALSILSGEKIRTEIKQVDAFPGKGEEGVITRMPDYTTIDDYASAMERVMRDIDRLLKNDLRSSEAGIRDLTRLIDTGARNMVSLMLKFVRDGSSQSIDMDSIIRDGQPSPQTLLPTLTTVTTIQTLFLRLLPPPSHPTHQAFTASLSQFQSQYASLRREWISTRCLTPLIREFDDLVEGPMSPGREDEGRVKKGRLVARIAEGVLVMLQSEDLLLRRLFPSSDPSIGLNTIFALPVSTFSDLLLTQLSTIKKSLSIHTFLAFELYSVLTRLQGRWEDTMSRIGMGGKESGVVQEVVGGLKGLCLRSFPEVLVDVKSPPVGRAAEGTTVAIAEVTYSTVTYLETLPLYEPLVDSLLNTLGERNWLMGAAMPSARDNEDDGIVQRFVADLLGALGSQLEGRSRAMKRPVGSVFLLNNLSYMRNNLILGSSSATDILGQAGQDQLNRSFRDAKGKYLDSWQSLADQLLDANPTSSSSSRFGAVVGVGRDGNNAKDNIGTFFTRLEEMESMSRQYGLSKQDPNLRDRLKVDVRNIVMPAFNSFVAKNQKYEKYIKATPQEVENRLTALFR